MCAEFYHLHAMLDTTMCSADGAVLRQTGKPLCLLILHGKLCLVKEVLLDFQSA
jgi:hypothetical protein